MGCLLGNVDLFVGSIIYLKQLVLGDKK